MSTSSRLSVVLASVALVVALSSLYLGRLADKIGLRVLLGGSTVLSLASVIAIHTFAGQLLYGVSVALIGLLISIETADRQGTSGKKFGALSFYIEISYAVSLLAGGMVPVAAVVPLVMVLLVLFLIFTETAFQEKEVAYFL